MLKNLMFWKQVRKQQKSERNISNKVLSKVSKKNTSFGEMKELFIKQALITLGF